VLDWVFGQARHADGQSVVLHSEPRARAPSSGGTGLARTGAKRLYSGATTSRACRAIGRVRKAWLARRASSERRSPADRCFRHPWTALPYRCNLVPQITNQTRRQSQKL
jgi:hypothetical protein